MWNRHLIFISEDNCVIYLLFSLPHPTTTKFTFYFPLEMLHSPRGWHKWGAIIFFAFLLPLGLDSSELLKYINVREERKKWIFWSSCSLVSSINMNLLYSLWKPDLLKRSLLQAAPSLQNLTVSTPPATSPQLVGSFFPWQPSCSFSNFSFFPYTIYIFLQSSFFKIALKSPTFSCHPFDSSHDFIYFAIDCFECRKFIWYVIFFDLIDFINMLWFAEQVHDKT